MDVEIKIDVTYKDKIINSIIDEEWVMFGRVNNQNGRAACQDDAYTFYIMRYSMFNIMSEETLKSYLNHIREAGRLGRNLLAEKYGYMMEYTDKEYYDNVLKDKLPSVSKEKETLIFEITKLLSVCQSGFEKKYPNVSSKGRSNKISEAEEVTVNIYTIGELKTWSMEALLLYLKDVTYICSNNENPIIKIQEKTVQMYGYKDLDDAEKKVM